MKNATILLAFAASALACGKDVPAGIPEAPAVSAARVKTGIPPAYAATGSLDVDLVTGVQTEIVRLSVPAGSYVVSGRSQWFVPTSGGTVGCQMSVAPSGGAPGVIDGASQSGGGFGAVALLALADVPAGGDLVLTCGSPYDGARIMPGSRLIAMEVAP